jgi:hypothetical protein
VTLALTFVEEEASFRLNVHGHLVERPSARIGGAVARGNR